MRLVMWALPAIASCRIGFDRVPDGSEPDPLGSWAPAMPVTLSPSGAFDWWPSLTEDELELYVMSASRAGSGSFDVFVASRASKSDAWSTPQPVSVSGPATDLAPRISADGLTLLFSSDRVEAGEHFGIFAATRESRQAPWGPPTLVVELDSPSGETPGCVTADGLAMVFASNRRGNGLWDLYATERANANDSWGVPQALALDAYSSSAGATPCLANDRRSLYFNSDRGNPSGPPDLYVAHREGVAEPFTTAEPISEINSSVSETGAWISPDERTLYFSRADREPFEIWYSTR